MRREKEAEIIRQTTQETPPHTTQWTTRTLAAANVNISSAVIATYGEQVVDTFYVKDMFGLKLHSKTKRDSLEQKLREALKQGATRALS